MASQPCQHILLVLPCPFSYQQNSEQLKGEVLVPIKKTAKYIYISKRRFTSITGERETPGRGVRVGYVEVVMFVDSVCGLIAEPAGVRHEEVLIARQNLGEIGCQ